MNIPIPKKHHYNLSLRMSAANVAISLAFKDEIATSQDAPRDDAFYCRILGS